MIFELDDDYSDDVTVANLAQSYAAISKNIKEFSNWHEDDVAAWEQLLPAIMLVGKWYSYDFEKDIKKAGKNK
jgi:hypothetical protein